MGLNVRIYNINATNSFTLSYKTGQTLNGELDGFTTYNGTYDSSDIRDYYSNPIIVTGLSFNTQYWFKITDSVTNRYIIENIYTHESLYYDCYIPPSPSPTPTVTPTNTPSITPTLTVTPSVSPSYAVPSVTPTTTPTITITPSVTPSITPSITATPSITPSTSPPASLATVYWTVRRSIGGGSADLTIKDSTNAIVLGPITTSASPQTGTFTIPFANVPFTVYVDNVVNAYAEFRICNMDLTTEIYYNSVSGSYSDIYAVSPTPLNTSVELVYGGTPVVCGV